MKELKDKEFRWVLKVLLILVCLYIFMLALECIVGSIWNLLLFLAITITVLWCYYRKKRKKSYIKGVLLLIILILLLIFSIGPCVYERHIAEMNETKLEEKQREIEAEKYTKEVQENMERTQEETREEQTKRKVEEDEIEKNKKSYDYSAPIYNFKEDKDCSDFSNASEATEFMKKSISAGFGDHRLDRNKDGIACN
ncbi:excalibur calcium-binding domain-containing protein [Priestia filamentosa]|uniref:excalibur calcium-binding domain-containing protein n=1 Tax=Priestia filamentosa TaxID=1402861 RepID=UPI001FB4BA98|nr:excalibur calcium-binding domain-containing protein [Priestia filamentosa]